MKKITLTQFKELKGMKAGRVQHEVTTQVLSLDSQEAVYIEKGEWIFKTPPNIYVHQLKTKTGKCFSVKTMPNGDISILRTK